MPTGRAYDGGVIAPTAPMARALRALAVGAVVTTVAVLAHVLGHGTPPPVVALVPVVAVVAAVALAMSGRRWSFGALVLGVGTAQVAVHGLSVYLTGDAHVSVAMIAAHVVATLVSCLLLSAGESLWWRLWRWMTRALPQLTLVAPPSLRRLPGYGVTSRIVPVGWHADVLPTRGPPSFV